MRLIAFLANVPMALAVGVGAPAAVWSAPITAAFEGTITDVDDPRGVLGPPFEVGAPFTVTYSLDPDAASAHSPFCRAYCYYTGLPKGSFAASLAIGNDYWSSIDVNVEIFNDDPLQSLADLWALDAVSDPLIFEVFFFDIRKRRISDASFFVNESLEEWTGGRLLIRQFGTDGANVEGTIIPEPTPLALLIPALVAVLACARFLRHRRGAWPLVLLAVLGAPTTALSVPITVMFPGVFTEITDPDGLLPPDVNEGAPFTVSYNMVHSSFSECLGDGVDTLRCGAFYPSRAWTASLSVGETILSGVFQIWITDSIDPPGYPDVWQVRFIADQDPILRSELRFIDMTGTRVPGVYLENDSLDGWTEATLSIVEAETGQLLASGRVIPEPTSVALLLPALVGVLVRARLRRSHACQLDRQS